MSFQQVQCPYCGEPIEMQVDRSAGSQAYVEDCSVCCRPIEVRLSATAMTGVWRWIAMTTDYVPIDCDQHSVLELLAMRRARVSVRVEAAGAELRLEAVVCDVLTRDGAEYLILRDAGGEELSVRLDRLLGVSRWRMARRLWRQKTVPD